MRVESGLTQLDVAGRLGISRSTLANIEAGREQLSFSLRSRVIAEFPEWQESVSTGRYLPSITADNNSIAVVELQLAYLFSESRSPSEILEVRRVRALRAGVQHYVMGLHRTDRQELSLDTEVLWGGWVTDEATSRDSHVRRVVTFPRELRRGEVHEFALRSWLERDGDPDTEIRFEMTTATEVAHIHLSCLGTPQIAKAWTFGPLQRPGPGPIAEASRHSRPVAVLPGRPLTVSFTAPQVYSKYGIAWQWAEQTNT